MPNLLEPKASIYLHIRAFATIGCSASVFTRGEFLLKDTYNAVQKKRKYKEISRTKSLQSFNSSLELN